MTKLVTSARELNIAEALAERPALWVAGLDAGYRHMATDAALLLSMPRPYDPPFAKKGKS